MPTGRAMGGGQGGGGAGDVRAGGAYFEVFAKDKLTPQLDKMKSKATGFGDHLKTIGKRMAVAALAAGAGVTALLVGGVSRHAEVAQMADRFQIPIALMSKLKHVADEAGVSVEDVMTDATGRYTDRISAAPAMNESHALKALEIQRKWTAALHDLQDAMMPLVEIAVEAVKVFADLAKGLKDIVGREPGAAPGGLEKHLAMALPGGMFGLDVAREIGNALGLGPGSALGPGLAAFAAPPKPPPLTMSPTGVRGAFQTFGAMGQFGFGEKNEVVQQTEILKRLLNGEGALPGKIGKELAGVLGMK